MKFNRLNVPEHWQHYWSRYPEGYTILEALISWVSQVDDMTENVNNWNEYLEDFVIKFDKELQNNVTEILTDWHKSGFLDVVINEALDTKYHEMDARLTAQLTQKATKGEIGLDDLNKNITQFDETWFTDSVKQQWTGQTELGQTVPDKSVTSQKLANKSVDVEHLSSRLEPELLAAVDVPYEIGSLDSSNGDISDNTIRIRTRTFVRDATTFTFEPIREDIEYALFEYDNNNTRLTSTSFIKEPVQKLNPNRRYKVIVRFNDNRSLVESDIPTLTNGLVFTVLRRELEQPKQPINELIEKDTVINHFDKNNVVQGYYGSKGELLPHELAVSSHLIDIYNKNKLTYFCNHESSSNNHFIALFDKDGIFLERLSRTLENATLIEIELDNPFAKWVSVAIHTHSLDETMVILDQPYPDSYIPYGRYVLKNNVVIPQATTGENKLNSLKWGIVGDSISTVGYKGGEYPEKIASKHNMITQNLAIPGSLIAKSTKTGQETSHICERVLLLDTDCDVVTVAGGTNDQRFNLPIGTFEDTSIETFYGAMHTLCTNMITRFPETPKAIFTPTKMRGANPSLKNYVDVIKEVAAYYSIPVCDNFNEADLQPDIDTINNTYFSSGDGIHPNTRGHDILARKVENFLLTLV